MEYRVSNYFCIADCAYSSSNIYLPKWKKQNTLSEETTSEKVLSLKEILAIPGAKAIMVCFFLLLCRRTDNHAMGKQLFESGKRCRCQNGSLLCGYVLHWYYDWSWNQWIYCHETERQTDDSYGTGNYHDWHYHNDSSIWAGCFVNRIFVDWIRLCTDISLYYPFHARAFWSGTFTGNYRGADGKCLYWNVSDAAIIWLNCEPHIYPVITVIFVDFACIDGVYA